jgi:hypothetical protein
MWFDSTAAQLNADVPVDAYIIYACSGKFKTLVRIQPSVRECIQYVLLERGGNTHLKVGLQSVESFFSFGDKNLRFVEIV